MLSKGTEYTGAILSLKSNHQITRILYDQASQTTQQHALRSKVYQGKSMTEMDEIQW